MGRWVYGLDHNGDRGEVNGLKKTDSLSLTIASYGRGLCQTRACSLRSGTVLSRKVVGKTAHSPFQSDSPVPVRPQRDRGHTKRRNANRQVKQAAEGSQKSGRVKSRVKSEK